MWIETNLPFFSKTKVWPLCSVACVYKQIYKSDLFAVLTFTIALFLFLAFLALSNPTKSWDVGALVVFLNEEDSFLSKID